MKRIVRPNNRGFTLVEVLVAMVILSIAMLAILEAMTIAMKQNLESYCRDEAVRIAEQEMNQVRNIRFSDVASSNYDVTRKYKQVERRFDITRTVAELSDNSRFIQLEVRWVISGRGYSHYATSIISRGI